MVSIDHLPQELLAQMARAAGIGRIDLLINSGEQCRSIPTGAFWSPSCRDASHGPHYIEHFQSVSTMRK